MVGIFLVRFKPADKGLLAYGEEELSDGAGASTSKQQMAASLTGVSATKALTTPSFWLIFIAAGLLSFNGIFTQHIPSYVISLGLSPATGAAIISTIMLVSIAAKIALGAINDKLGIIKSSTLGIFVVIAGLAVFLISGQNTALLTAGAVLFGLGLSVSAVEPPLLVRQVFGMKDYSSIYSYVMMALNLMAGIGVSVFGFMYDLLGSYGPVIMVVIASYIVVLLAIILSINLGRSLSETAIVNSPDAKNFVKS